MANNLNIATPHHTDPVMENLSKRFIKGLTNRQTDYEMLLVQIVERLKLTEPHVHVHTYMEQRDQWLESFRTVLGILNCQVELNESDGQCQTIVVSSLAIQMQRILDCNYHNVVRKCGALDDKKHCCKNGNPLIQGNMHSYECNFHDRDSLATHLMLACIINGFRAINMGKDRHFVSLCQFTGLVHDIGKQNTIQTYDFKKKLFTGFPAHGEVGKMIMMP